MPAFSAPRHTGEASILSNDSTLDVFDEPHAGPAGREHREHDDRPGRQVELTPAALRAGEAFYREHLAESQRLYDRYNLEQIELLLGFTRHGREFNELRATRLEQQTRDRAREAYS